MVRLLEPLLLATIFLTCSAGSVTSKVPASLPILDTNTSNITDHLALMAFKSFIRSDTSQALASWHKSVPLCRWHGVVCGVRGGRRGRVVALDLPGLGLHGILPPEVGNITYLRRLHLGTNQLHGALPPELGNLPDLTHLNLSYNSFQGSIPASLSNCTRLEDLVLYSNTLDGEIPQEICLLRNLEVLSLGMNALTGSIPMEIGGLVSLTYLNLLSTNLTGEIPQQVGGLVKLAQLGIGHNLLTGPIPASFGNLSALKILSIAYAHLTGSISPLQNLSSLEVIDLSGNNLSGTIPPWVGNLSSLEFLAIHTNSLTGSIPESLGSLQSLSALSFAENNLSGSIPQSLGNLGAIQILHLQNNQLEGSFTPLLNLSSLANLLLSINRLSGSLPPDIGHRLPNIQMLLVDSNQFHGTIPPSLCNVSMLYGLQAFSNFFSGKIPPCLGARQKLLSFVILGQNQLEIRNDADWDFLSSLTNCSAFEILDLNSNIIRGEIPSSIGNLSSHMKFLTLDNNNIHGEIPEGIGKLINLELLYMGNNQMEGTIPASLGQLKILSQLSLQNNKLSGSIPPTLGNLTTLNILLLQGNALDGGIPSSLRSCPLEQLDLSYNSLTGPIPNKLFLIPTLSNYMHLGHNFLSGTLPSEIGNLVNLGVIDLSSNNISGEIPTSIGHCLSLQDLNMSGNFLQGKIPPSFAQLKGLLVLDLSHNNLSGTIPTYLGIIRGLSTLNISFNKFEGEVPEEGIFLNATATSVTGNDGLCGGIPQLKLRPCPNRTTKKPSQRHVIIISICSAVAFITLVFALSIFYQRSRKKKDGMQASLVDEQYMRISYAELADATNGFNSENLIGAGSFGSVYKGTIRSNGQQLAVAVKVLNLTQRGASQSFVAECETLRYVRHRNLIKILTVCASIDFQGREFKAIVYEFLANGNLDKWLHQRIMEDGGHRPIDLQVTLQIAIDVASSMEYLHQQKPLPIIHSDLKPSNILLDGEMVAHVGDFGLARFLYQDSDKSSGWASMRGTVGYAAPEYGLGNEVSILGDVYSFGILLLEMFTGKRPTDNEFGEALGLRKYVQSAFADRVADVIDNNLLLEIENSEAITTNHNKTSRDIRVACISSILHTGISCSAEIPTDRMQIGDALKELQAIRDRFHKELLRDGEP